MNYKTGDLLRACLRSLEEYVHVPYEVIVVDNASDDPALNLLVPGERLRIIRNSENLGFAKACNIGARVARGRVLHFLNPDTEVTHGLDKLYREALARGPSAIFVTRILNARGELEKASHAFPTFQNLMRLVSRRGEIACWYLGASFLLDASLYWNLGGLSEEYFMYGEDVDFFYKAYLKGVPVIEASAKVMHISGGASQKVWTSRQRLERVERGATIFTSKFRLRLSYFIFRHLAFAARVWRDPSGAALQIGVYWKELLSSLWRTPRAKLGA